MVAIESKYGFIPHFYHPYIQTNSTNTSIKREYFINTPFVLHILVKFTFSSSFRFLFTSYAWFLVMFSFTNLLLDTSLCTVSFKSA